MERKRINYIDWLRIISALAVIGIHITFCARAWKIQLLYAYMCMYTYSMGCSSLFDD